jgi:hypothetical protein
MSMNLSKSVLNVQTSSTESAVKLLKSFEKDGLIELQEKDIVVINQGGLIEISKKG